MVRNVIFGGIAVSLAVAYLFIASQLTAVVGGPAPGEPTPVPTRPPERTGAPRVPGSIAFVLRGDVYVLRDGRYAPVTSHGRASEPHLSADGETLLYARRETIDGKSVTVEGQVVKAQLGYTVIVRTPGDGGSEELVADGLRARSADGFHNVWWYSGPALDAEGERMAVTAAGIGSGADLHVVTFGNGARPSTLALSQGAELADPAWSPDGESIAVTTYNTAVPGVLIWDAGRPGAAERLDLPEGEAYRPSFSPDGEWIIYTLRVNGRNDLHAYEIETQTDVALTTDGRSWGGVFSPDGDWVAFLRQRDGVIDVYAMELGDALARGQPKEAVRLTQGEGIDGESRPSWGR